MPKASIIIPTLNREGILEKCLASIKKQTFKDYEIIILREEGELSTIRNRGARQATGDIFCFIDDDTITTPVWLQEIINSFCRRSVKGVSGTSVISRWHRYKRDLFRHKTIKKIYDRVFLEGRQYLPGHFTDWGAWTTGACEESCNYEGEVHFLEACNMSFKRDAFEEVGGFDEAYKGIGDWSEPDLAFRIRARGHLLWFNPRARLYHEPSQTGAYYKRRVIGARLTNYELFSRRWIKPSFKHTLYKLFLKGYYYGFKAVK